MMCVYVSMWQYAGQDSMMVLGSHLWEGDEPNRQVGDGQRQSLKVGLQLRHEAGLHT